MNQVPNVRLNNGVEIPQLGFGVFQVPPDGDGHDGPRRPSTAGYRHIDTATMVRQRAPVSAGPSAESGLARGDVYVTTKVATEDQGYDSTLRAFDASVGRLGIELVSTSTSSTGAAPVP